MSTATGRSTFIPPRRLVWLAELEPICHLLDEHDTPEARRLRRELRATARHVQRSRRAPTAFHYAPSGAAIDLLHGVLERVRSRRAVEAAS